MKFSTFCIAIGIVIQVTSISQIANGQSLYTDSLDLKYSDNGEPQTPESEISSDKYFRKKQKPRTRSSEHDLVTLNFSLPQGFYQQAFDLQIQADLKPHQTIYYTTDGNTPAPNTHAYASAIPITASAKAGSKFAPIIIRAAVFDQNGERISKIYSKSYFVHPDIFSEFSHPVISLITAPANLYDFKTGIYVAGANYSAKDPTWTGNYYMKGINWERDIHIEYFESNGDKAFSQDAGVRIHGGKQRAAAQKSFRFYARKEYGDNDFSYQLMPQSTKNDYKRFILRTSMGSWNIGIITDPLIHSLSRGLGFETQNYRPVEVFLNGSYWGLYTIRDYYSGHHFEEEYGVDKESVNINLYTSATEGNADKYIAYEALLREKKGIIDNDLYKITSEVVDIHSFTNHHITEIFFNNYDWPQGNQRSWMSEDYDGKYRWMLYDLDAAFEGRNSVTYNSLAHATKAGGTSWPNPDNMTYLLRALLTYKPYRDMFCTRTAYIMNYYFSAGQIVDAIERMEKEYGMEMPNQISRWNVPASTESWAATLSKMKAFGRARRGYMENFYKAQFSLSGIAQLTAEANDTTMGDIFVYDMPIPHANNSGTYFTDVKIELKAIAKSGYKFVRWENTDTDNNANTSTTLNKNKTVRAIFMEDIQSPDLVINEVLAKNDRGITDEWGDNDDWIELYNAGPGTVDLNGLFLSDDKGNLMKFKINSQHPITIAPGAFILLWADGETEQGCLHTNFKLSAEGETLYLCKSENGIPVIIDEIAFPSQGDNESFGRLPDGGQDLIKFIAPTPEANNRLQRNNNLIVTELNFHSNQYYNDEDWIEIQNISESSLNISGWQILNGDSVCFTFPAGTIIGEGEYLLIVADPIAFEKMHEVSATIYSPLTNTFSKSGDFVKIVDSQGLCRLAFRYSDQSPWQPSADGHGRTLSLIDKHADIQDPVNWACGNIGGTPGTENYSEVEQILISEISADTKNGLYWFEIANKSSINISASDLLYSVNTTFISLPVDLDILAGEYWIITNNRAAFTNKYGNIAHIAESQFEFIGDEIEIGVYTKDTLLIQAAFYTQDRLWTSADEHNTLVLNDKSDNNASQSDWYRCNKSTPGNKNTNCQSDSTSISFVDGWNMFSMPSIHADIPANKFGGKYASHIDVIKDYDDFYIKNTDAVISTLNSVKNGSGYLVKVTGAFTYTIEARAITAQSRTITLTKGWNLVGLSVNQEIPVSQFINEISNTIEVIKDDQNFYMPGNSKSNLSVLKPYKAYFIKVNKNCSVRL